MGDGRLGGMTAVISGEELVVLVLVELSCPIIRGAASWSPAATATIAVVGVAITEVAAAVVVVCTMVLSVVVTWATLVLVVELEDAAAATLGTAVHLLPSMVVRNAPAGRLFDAIFSLYSLSLILDLEILTRRCQSRSRREGKKARQNKNKNKHKTQKPGSKKKRRMKIALRAVLSHCKKHKGFA